MSPLQKHAKLIRFSRPACRPSLLLSAQGRGRRSGSFWEPLPRSPVPLEWYNSDIIASSHSCRMSFLHLCPQWLLKDGRREKNSPIRDGFLNCKDFSSFSPAMTSEQGFHDGSTPRPTSQTPSSSTDGLLQLQPLFSSLAYFRVQIHARPRQTRSSIEFPEIHRSTSMKSKPRHRTRGPAFVICLSKVSK